MYDSIDHLLANVVRNFLGVPNFLGVRNFFSAWIGCTEYLGCGEPFFLVSGIFFWEGGRKFFFGVGRIFVWGVVGIFGVRLHLLVFMLQNGEKP